MRGKNHFEPASFAMGNTYNERTTKFVGVDLTSPQVEVDLKRGVYSNNYVKKANGKVETRFGYSVAFKDPNIKLIALWQLGRSYVAAVRVYSGGTYGDNYHRYQLVQVDFDGQDGTLQIVRTVFEKPTFAYRSSTYDVAFGTESNGRFWVVFGWEYLVLTGYQSYPYYVFAYKVQEWSHTHIPTVTYMGVATNAANIPSVTNVTLEYPNLLSKYRRDMFLTGLGIAENTGKYAKYKLKGTVSLDGIEIKLETNSEPLTVAYTAVLSADAVVATNEQVSQEAAGFINNYMKKGDLIFSFDDEFEAYTGQNGYYDTSAGFLFIEGTDIGLDGVIHLEEDGSATLYLFSDPVPAVAGKPNLTVKYAFVSNSDFEKNVDFVTNNRYGTLFGKNNSLNRLWLYGDVERPNYAIHSAEPYKNLDTNPTRGEGDFSYFPDEGVIKFGEADNAIIGMIPLSPDKMMVLKDYAPGQRAMYFVTPIDISETIIAAGTYGSTVQYTVASDVSITREEYSTAMSNTTTAGFSPKTVDVVNGEALFVSNEKQLVGLDIEGITGDSRRVASTRSHFIDKALMKDSLSNAVLYHTGNYIFLSSDTKLYVTTWDSLSSETKQYEWWPCDPIKNVQSFFTAKNGRIFACSNGVLYEIIDNTEERVDIDREFFDVSVASGTGTIVVSSAIASKLPSVNNVSTATEDDLWEFGYEQDFTVVTNSNLHYCPGVLLISTNISNPKIKIIGEYPNTKYSFIDAYLERQARRGEWFIRYTRFSTTPAKFKFKPLNEYDETTGKEIFALLNEDGTTNTANDRVNEYFYCVVPNTEVYAFANNAEQGEICLYGKANNGTLQKLYPMPAFGENTCPSMVDGLFMHKQAIKPLFATLRLTQGKLGYDKTIDNLTIWNDSENPCELYVGVLRNKQGEVKYAPALIDQGIGFDLEDVDFTQTSFDKNAVPKFYNLKVLPRSQQSFTICFTAKSKRNSVLGGVDILYRVKKARNKR